MYDQNRAERYWSKTRFEQADDFAAVVGLSSSAKVNQAFDAWEASLLDRLHIRPIDRCLDVGCGIGRHTVRLAEVSEEVVGTDLSAEMIRRAAERADSLGLDDRVSWRQSPADNMPFLAGTFSVVLCMGLLEHVPATAEDAVLRSLNRVLAPGGRLMIEVNNEDSRYLRREAHRTAQQLKNGYFNRLCSPFKIRTWLMMNGFVLAEERSNTLYSIARHRFREHGVGIGSKLDSVLDLPRFVSHTRADHYVMLARKAG